MISIEQINGEISALEEEKPTYVVMQKLADLYIVRDHMTVGTKTTTPIQTTIVSETIPDTGLNSEFAKAVYGKSTEMVLNVLDEAMEVIRAINPGLYNGIMKKLA